MLKYSMSYFSNKSIVSYFTLLTLSIQGRSCGYYCHNFLKSTKCTGRVKHSVRIINLNAATMNSNSACNVKLVTFHKNGALILFFHKSGRVNDIIIGV